MGVPGRHMALVNQAPWAETGARRTWVELYRAQMSWIRVFQRCSRCVGVGATWQLQASCVRVEQELRIGFVLQVDDYVGSSGQQRFWRQVEGIRQADWLGRVWMLYEDLSWLNVATFRPKCWVVGRAGRWSQ